MNDLGFKEEVEQLKKLAAELKTIGSLLGKDPFVSFDSNKVHGGTLENISRSINIISDRIEEHG